MFESKWWVDVIQSLLKVSDKHNILAHYKHFQINLQLKHQPWFSEIHQIVNIMVTMFQVLQDGILVPV